MKLTRSVGYAIGVLLRVAELDAEGPVTAAKISQGCKFPPRFLYRILRRLVDHELLVGVSGPGGGYRLAHPANRISLLEIVTAVENGQEPGRLVAVSRKQKSAVEFVNTLTSEHDEALRRKLERVKLSKLMAQIQ